MPNNWHASLAVFFVAFAFPGTTASQGSDVDLLVRTVNTESGDPHHPERLLGIAREFQRTWAQAVGLVGLQQVETHERTCPMRVEQLSLEEMLLGPSGVRCFGAILASLYGGKQPATTRLCGHPSLAIVVGGPWDLVGSECWKIGNDDVGWRVLQSDRYLAEATVRHSKYGWILRFYTTHLSHISDIGSRRENRHRQIDSIKSIIPARVGAGELPPIVVGDLNFNPADEPSSFERMNTHFQLVGPAGKMQIWIGRQTAFPQTKQLPMSLGSLCTFVTVLSRPTTIDGVTVPTLSDGHDSPGTSLGCPGWMELIIM